MMAEKCVNLYFARHGQTDWNKNNILQGARSDIPLNQTGRYQSDILWNYFRNTPLINIYSSPLVRALETAERINWKRKNEIEKLAALRERDFGDMDGQNYLTSQADRHAFLVDQNGPNPHGIETDEQIEKRLIPILKGIAVAHLGLSSVSRPANDLFVTHSGTLRFLLNHFGHRTYVQMMNYAMEETALVHVQFNGEGFKVVDVKGLVRRDNK